MDTSHRSLSMSYSRSYSSFTFNDQRSLRLSATFTNSSHDPNHITEVRKISHHPSLWLYITDIGEVIIDLLLSSLSIQSKTSHTNIDNAHHHCPSHIVSLGRPSRLPASSAMAADARRSAIIRDSTSTRGNPFRCDQLQSGLGVLERE